MPRRREYDHHFSVRVTGAELRQLHTRAETSGLSLSRYLVEAGMRPGRVASVEERAQRQRAIFHARKIGVNLNQLAHRLHSDDRVSADEVRRALEASTEALAQLVGNRHG